MRQLVTAKEIARVDREAQELGIPELVLMENAGRHAFRIWLAHALERSSPLPEELGPVVAVAGAGNNGGDSLVMARLCYDNGIPVTALVLRKELTGAPRSQLQILENLGVPIHYWDDGGGEELLARGRWVFDGIAGTGISGPLRGSYLEAVEAIGRSGARVVAIDLPSGMGDEFEPTFPTVRADLTVTMGVEKRALYHPVGRIRAGRITVGDPGFPRGSLVGFAPSRLAEEGDLPSLLPPLPGDAHKGQRGFLALFAGGEGTSGAAVLAGRSALSAGCGLLRLHIDTPLRAEAAVGEPAMMVEGVDPADPVGQIAGRLEGYTALAVGPGWGVSDKRGELLTHLLSSRLPAVVDADGLNNLARLGGGEAVIGESVLTPHPGEAARLLHCTIEEVLKDPPAAAARITATYRAVCLLKGAVTVITAPGGEEWFVEGLEPALGTAGSGDVLTGVIGSLLAQGLSPTDAAVAGALIHQGAGRRLREARGFFPASALAEAIGTLAARRGG
ncbi:MAG: NAD(P)H-hydrate dehydratase [Alkalispirochaetaceae bacterium]